MGAPHRLGQVPLDSFARERIHQILEPYNKINEEHFQAHTNPVWCERMCGMRLRMGVRAVRVYSRQEVIRTVWS